MSDEQQGAKRARRSKWDAPEPIISKPTAITTSSTTAEIPNSTSLPSNLPLVNTQENIIAQQAALQQSLALRQSLVSSNPLLSGLAGVALGTVSAAPGLQHRVYIGSKGFCFLEYSDPASASAAQAMDGFELAGRKIKVGRPFHGQGTLNSPAPSLNAIATAAALGQQLMNPQTAAASLLPQANQNLLVQALGQYAAAANPAAALASSAVQPMRCLLVRNITATVAVSEVEPIFAAFGTVARCVYVEDGTCSMTSIATKTALVEYYDSQTAATVALSMKNFNLAGFPLVVQMISSEQALQLVPSPTPAAVAKAAAAAFAAAASVSHSLPLSISSLAAAHTPPTSTANSALPSETTTNNTAPSSVRYKSLQLLNMVSVDELQDPDLKEEIAEEVRKYGQLLDIQFYITPSNTNKNSATVALRYATEEDTLRAYQALQDRAFANKRIVATLAP